jgi:hypothetical protein
LNVRSTLPIFKTINSVTRTAKFSLQNVQSMQISLSHFFDAMQVDFRSYFLKNQFKKSLSISVVAFFSKFMSAFLQLRNVFHEWLIRLCRFSTTRVGSERLCLSLTVVELTSKLKEQ